MELKKSRLTQARLKQLMVYDPETGGFTWKTQKGRRVRAGSKVGCISKGYSRCKIDNTSYFCHRLAWLYVYGYFPENGLDHINRVKTDNRIDNLREVSQQCNIRNSKQRTGTASGVRGVVWHKRANKWRAQITVNNKRHDLGIYKHKHNAACARLAAEQCLGWAGCDSNSPAYQYVQKKIAGMK